ncbi:hypothetical protein [Rurimicrobium arvi]|uniref:Holin n=1 Tax=Rurimicrobium arvi TaxID=2049916 RepID=A0ABP8MPW0_9BACT
MPISCYNTKSTIEIIMAVAMAGSIALLFYRSIKLKKGIGARIIQFACVLLIIPGLIILGLEDILHGETIATIIGGLIGYTLSGIGDYDKRKKGEETDR